MQEIDYNIGIENCGNDRMLYVMTLQSLLEHAPARLEHMQKMLEDGDCEAYSIEAHTLKSNALLIGAQDVHLEAKELEYGAKAKNIELLHKNTAQFVLHYERMLEEITNALQSEFQDVIEKPMELSVDEREECRSVVEEAFFLLTQKKIDETADCLEVLTIYNLPETMESKVLSILKAFRSGNEEEGVLEFMKFRDEL